MTIDCEAPLQRCFDVRQLDYIAEHPLFKAMHCGIDEGNILATLRKLEVHFYEAGARLLRFTGQNVFTHTHYIDCKGDKYRALRDDECKNPETLEKIRRAANEHKNAASELAAVHQLFPEFAITRSQHRADELALIDVEARFASGEFASGEKLPGGMIDLVFLLPDCRLLFIEAKCIGNPEVRSTKVAAVATQVRNYECHIVRGGVLGALNRSLCVQSRLIKRDLGQAKSIAPRVPVLILDPARCGLSPKSTDTWLKAALAAAPNWSFAPEEVAVIDGMSSSPAAAIRAYVGAFVAKFPT